MSLQLPSRRLLQSARRTTPILLPPSTSTFSPSITALRALSTTPSRPAWWPRFGKNKEDEIAASRQALKDLEKDREANKSNERKGRSLMSHLTHNRLQKDSIFSEAGEQEQQGERAEDKARLPTRSAQGASLVREHYVRAVDPDPRSRVRWERKMVTRMVRRRLNAYDGETRAERLRRTEREVMSKSIWLPTSVKKLGHLARQVAGKTVEDALTQMRFSKKKMAREVGYQLRLAQNEAITARGMGLGKEAAAAADGTALESAAQKIQTKDGKWVTVDDPTRLYVAQAWVTRGPIRDRILKYRARGAMNVWKSPSTGLTVLLKEEKTRVREFEERKAKKDRQGPWVHLPNRPVTSQRQYYSW